MRHLLMLIIVLLVVCPAAMSLAQNRAPQMETLSATGTVKGVRPTVLLVEVEGGRQWWVSMPSDYQQLVYEAKATTQWLMPRMPVRFNGTAVFDKRKREVVMKGIVSNLTVAPIRPDVGTGISPEQGADQRANLFARNSPSAKKKRARNEPVEMPCLIVGHVLENKAGKVRVVAGNYSVRLELDPKVEVDVQWHNLHWVRIGDKAEITARHPAGRVGQAQGQQITVTAAEVLDVAPKNAARGRRKDSRKEKTDEPKKSEPPKKKDEPKKK